MTPTKSKILARGIGVLGLLFLVGALAILAQENPGITFATKGISLKIDSKAWYNGAIVPSATWALKNLNPTSDKFFNFDDVKPGDFGCNVISMHVKDQDAWMCMDFENLTQDENGMNEPEALVDTTPGADLANGTEFFGWTDDGDGKYEPPTEKALFGTSTKAASTVLNDKTYVIGDSKQGGACRVNTTRYVGMCWCAGGLTVAANGKMTCDATKLGNAAQTDSFALDVAIRAEPTNQNSKFVCGGTPPGHGGGGGHDDDKDDKKDDDKNDDNHSGGSGGSSRPPQHIYNNNPYVPGWAQNAFTNIFNRR